MVVFDQQYRVRVAHRYGTDLVGLAIHLQGVTFGAALGIEGDLLWLQVWWPHVHPHLPISLQVQSDIAAGSAHGDLVAAGQPLVVHEARETAGAIAALFDLAAIGIEDPVIEFGIRVACRFDQQDLIAAHAEAPVGDGAQLGLVQDNLLVDSRRIRRSRCPGRASW